MGVSLYRKYRPQQFSDVIGQEPIITTLLNQSAKREFSHSYIFTGPRGVGKTTTARLLAKAANCLHPKKNGEPDNSCDACVSIQANRAIDILEIDAASHTGVDNVRTAIIDTTRIHPTQLTYKVFIIDEVHMLSTSAFNALLKTLEEPPEHVLFVLATTEIHKVPDTILSRCQRFVFNRISHSALVERLMEIAKKEKVKIDTSVLERIAMRAEGSSRDAESVLGQLMSFEEKHITDKHADMVLPRSTFDDTATFVHFLVERDRTKALVFIQNFVESGGHPNQFLNDVIVYVRSLLLVKQSSEKLSQYVAEQFPEKVVRQMNKDATSVSDSALSNMLEIFVRVKKLYQYPALPQLPLEIAVYDICDSEDENEGGHGTDLDKKKQIFSQEQIKEKTSKQEESKPKPMLCKKHKPSEVSLQIVKERWHDFTVMVRAVNRGLSMSMQVAHPVDIDGTTVTLAVPYTFHKERIDMIEHVRLIAETMSNHFGKDMKVRCIVKEVTEKGIQKESNVENVGSDSLWDQVVDAFGDQLA